MTPGPPQGPAARPERDHSNAAGVMVYLTDEQLEHLADLLAERLVGCSSMRGLVDAATLADELGLSPAWVREHADELGAIRLGDGPRPRLRFDVERARAALTARDTNGRSEASDPAPQQARHASRRRPLGTGAPLLPIRGERRVA